MNSKFGVRRGYNLGKCIISGCLIVSVGIGEIGQYLFCPNHKETQQLDPHAHQENQPFRPTKNLDAIVGSTTGTSGDHLII